MRPAFAFPSGFNTLNPSFRQQRRFACMAFTMFASTLCTPALAQFSLSQSPLFLTQGQSPLVLLTMARDHKLFYEAYNDYSDLDGDGSLDVGYKPDAIDYYGYFDFYKCYTYDSGNGRFVPSSATLSATVNGVSTPTKKCSGQWSGDFLNYVTMSRMDALRKVLYGGYRSTDTAELTVLERSFIPQDAHSWGKEYSSIARDGYDIREYTPLSLPKSGRYHILANTTLNSDTSPPLMRVLTNTNFRVWEWLSKENPVAGDKCAVDTSCTSASGSALKNYTVRVEVCNKNAGHEGNCKTYGSSSKPIGLLQRQGENNGMYFGLLSGSYANNTQGGVLRKMISSITNEITEDGRFGSTTEICTSGSNCVTGIINTINKLKISGFSYSSKQYECGWLETSQMNNGQCDAWGNPIGEMLYEGLRYFSGKGAPTPSFTYDGDSTDSNLGLPQITAWTNPYTDNAITTSSSSSSTSFASCAKPYALLISDVYPSFDSDTVPGSAFGGISSDIENLNIETIGSTIWNKEMGTGEKNIFIGHSITQDGKKPDGTPKFIVESDGTPTAKKASSFGTIRGLAPGEPTREGSYSSAAAAYFGHITDLNPASGNQKLSTYSVALAAPLPTLEIPVGTNKVTILPFAKSVGKVSGSTLSIWSGAFQPTNQIVDYYIDTIRNVPGSPSDTTVNGGRPYYKFRINYEDVEQGADHDMDAIALYEVKLNSNNKISVSVTADYAKGGIVQHMGFAISGTTKDGAYLVIRDNDTTETHDKKIGYALDCHTSSTDPSQCVHVATGTTPSSYLPLSKELIFTVGNTNSAILLENPLWYAAKWGGFVDDNGNDLPDSTEWDADQDGVPDNYFLVTNPLNLENQLTKAFAKIKNDSATAAATSTNSFSYQSDSTLYQARFSSDGWSGELNAYPINEVSSLGDATWQAHYVLADISASDRQILTYDPDAQTKGIPFDWDSMTNSDSAYLRTSLNKDYNGQKDKLGPSRVSFLRGNSVANMRTRPYIKGTHITNKLGDIVSSQPQYVAVPNFGYGDNAYANFRIEYENRLPMIYVGANDGMLHGFSAEDGSEKLAYIPSEMYRTRNEQPLLSKLTSSNYGQSGNAHAYYVDGTPTIGDICTAPCAAVSNWKTILVGGLNAGGQGIYALDITNPGNFSEEHASSLVLWEFNDRQDTDEDNAMQYALGYTFSRPTIVKVCTNRSNNSGTEPKSCTAGKWVVIFGNGYNNTEADGYASTTGYAVLYVLDALTGEVIKKINTKAGSPSAPNGLATPAAVDVDNDDYVDYVYAGDLLGNLWKFDFTSDQTTNWNVAYGTPENPAPLYTAKTGGISQKITTAPDAMLHPNGGIQVVFGTGSYISKNDKEDTSQNTLYGIRDTGAAIDSSSLTNLQQQTVNTNSATVGSIDYRTISTNDVPSTKKGWYLHLPDSGERVAYDPKIIGSVLAFTTTVPTDDICGYGGWSWDYYIDAVTGARLPYSAFLGIEELNYGEGDNSISGFASARKSGVGITPDGTLITQGKGRGKNILCGSTGECEDYDVNLRHNLAGRISWREIIRE